MATWAQLKWLRWLRWLLAHGCHVMTSLHSAHGARRRVLQEIEAPASHEVQMHLVSYVLQFDLRVTKDTVRTQTTSEER